MWLRVLFLSLALGIASFARAETPPAAADALPRFAVTLFSSFDPIPDERVPADLPNAYRAQATVFGKNVYYLRVGFYPGVAEASEARKTFAARYPGAFVSEISGDEYSAARRGREAAVTRAAALRATPSPGMALVILFRGEREPVSATVPVSINGKRVGQLDLQGFVIQSVAPGTVMLNTGDQIRTSLAIEVAANQSYFIWVEAVPGSLPVRTEMRLVSEAAGRRALRQGAAEELLATTPAAAAPAASREEIYSITLASDPARTPPPAGPLPKTLADKQLYALASEQNGKTANTLNLGFFPSLSAATEARRLLLPEYPKASIRAVTPSEREASAASLIKAPERIAVAPAAAAGAAAGAAVGATDIAAAAAPSSGPPSTVSPERPLPAPVVAVAGTPAVEAEATSLLDRARDALTRGDNIVAIQLLDQILRLPPNRQSQEAQELIGVAHERLGEKTRAKREYELYLKLYATGPGPDRVRQRLANLDAPAETPDLKTASRRNRDITTAYGSWSQYYYNGATKTDTTTQVGPIQNQSSFTATDQNSLISSIDLNGRMRRGDYDNRVVLRDTYSLNFLKNGDDTNRLYSAYYELRNSAYEYGARLGRQPGNAGGVLSRFDGLSAGYNFLPKWRANIVAGTPADYNPINSDRVFWGTSLNIGTFAEHWNGSVYYIHQTIDGITDREAVGAELRYFDPKRSLMALTDYDLYFATLNIFMLQGTWQFTDATNANLLLDHRMAPPLQISNALIGETDTSIKSQLQTKSEEQLKQQAEDRTPKSDLAMVGLTHNFTKKWQLGGDVKLYKISATPASGALPANPGTGNVLIYTVQGIGTGVMTGRDISVLSFSYLDSKSYTGKSVSFSNRLLIKGNWTTDLGLRYYVQEEELRDMTIWGPTLRVSYRWGERTTLEAEYGLEKTNITSATDTQDLTRNYFSLGYRLDF
ncbi:MAG: hypothetical protein AMJ84_10395 [Acidithiobacillales bacterium SM23_46]|nr:MAG: hypothetical protein AMJ84_10395 [Acidithiobacillales bacterium SM23_46]